MKKLNFSVIHIILVLLVFLYEAISAQQPLEIIPYRLVPSGDVYCQISIEIVEPVTFKDLPDIYKSEIIEVLWDRVVYEQTSPFAINEPFQVDDKYYQLVRIPNNGDRWYQGPWNHRE
tara:strand:- start:861 stop:1214 length:354 start_codon:yes stop_codon:yes gene_type:complete